jgi:selenide, water dikinase
LKILKTIAPEGSQLTMICEGDRSFYSGMLPGSTANIYDPKQIQVELGPVAKWCKADFIQKRVTKIAADNNQVELDDGTVVDYDVLALNVGSKTRNTFKTPGVLEYSLTTRPINDLLDKIEKKEKELLKAKITPKLVIVGAGCAGVELSFGFKNRWKGVFGKDIETTLLSAHDCVLPHEKDALRGRIEEKLSKQGVQVETNCYVTEVTEEGVVCKDGRKFEGNVVVWCTGAEPQPVIEHSDLEMSKGYFRVNSFMQSTSHPNVFAGGDCVTMTPYEKLERPFPPKAGVYAVRGGPVISNNIAHFLKGEKLEKYEPQSEFLALLMTGDKKAVGTKFGFAFDGKWVWNLKDYIDVGFMKLFDPHYLFKDYAKKGFQEPMENNELFDEEKKSSDAEKDKAKKEAEALTPEEAAKLLKADEDNEEFLVQFMALERMKKDKKFREGVQKAMAK